ncbi:MAG: hypothetical protein P4L91_04035 [Burkholderiaceae bacterium]|nr:hypothetical protein [Burkholderiaceae bacterium]
MYFIQKFVPALLILVNASTIVSTKAAPVNSVNYGRYVLSGTIQNGSGLAPGTNDKPKPGHTYPGLQLDTPVDITRMTKGMDRDVHPELQRGYLENIQLVMNAKNAGLYKRYYGRHVNVECDIDFVGRYYTPVFCEVISIVQVPLQ